MPFETATQWIAALRRKEISSVELLQLYLSRAERANAAFNIVVALDPEGAFEAARRADRARMRGDSLGPLAGLPITIKDSFEVVGMASTCGMPELRDHRPTLDADPVWRLRSAGAIPFGKTNLPQAATDHQSNNPLFGMTLNPWDTQRTVGGSSGGSAAALATDLTPLELGSDIGGSIRIPAHFCGVSGHKSTHGIISMRGHIPPLPGMLLEPELGVGGPMARSAADLQLALDVLAGPNDLDAVGWALTLPPSRHETLREFRVAAWLDAFPADERYVEAIRSWIEDLRRLGVRVDDMAKPTIDVAQSYELYLETLYAVTRTDLPAEQRRYLADAARDVDPDHYIARLARYACPTLAQWDRIQERRARLFREYRRFFHSYDLILCPVAPTWAFPHDHSGAGPFPRFFRELQMNAGPVPYLDLLMWSSLATCANLPATVMPIGRRIEGLPLGVQIIGPLYADKTTLRFAELIESALGGFVPPPLARA